ncbi:MAG: cytochrome c [Gemmatimonadetes bacterium]|nr:cytochrome c [Gemmatimonadota bacterium]
MSRVRALVAIASAWLVLFAGWGCPWFTNMADQPSVRPYESEPRPAVAGTVPVGYALPPAITYEAANTLPNPVPPTAEVRARGKRLYEINCLVCHGARGAGDGPVVPKFVRPPTLKGASRGFSDGYIYALITNGRGNMPSYNRIPPEERWQLIHYLRALQSSP